MAITVRHDIAPDIYAGSYLQAALLDAMRQNALQEAQSQAEADRMRGQMVGQLQLEGLRRSLFPEPEPPPKPVQSGTSPFSFGNFYGRGGGIRHAEQQVRYAEAGQRAGRQEARFEMANQRADQASRRAEREAERRAKVQANAQEIKDRLAYRSSVRDSRREFIKENGYTPSPRELNDYRQAQGLPIAPPTGGASGGPSDVGVPDMLQAPIQDQVYSPDAMGPPMPEPSASDWMQRVNELAGTIENEADIEGDPDLAARVQAAVRGARKWVLEGEAQGVKGEYDRLQALHGTARRRRPDPTSEEMVKQRTYTDDSYPGVIFTVDEKGKVQVHKYRDPELDRLEIEHKVAIATQKEEEAKRKKFEADYEKAKARLIDRSDATGAEPNEWEILQEIKRYNVGQQGAYDTMRLEEEIQASINPEFNGAPPETAPAQQKPRVIRNPQTGEVLTESAFGVGDWHQVQ